jgi:hypothetical protein
MILRSTAACALPTSFSAADAQEVRALFLRQAAAETAHDIFAIDQILARAAPGESDPVNFIARAYRFWGREAVMEHFRKTFLGIWRFEPDEAAIRIVSLGANVAHIYAPTKITIGAALEAGSPYQFLVNEIAIRTAAGWRISTIMPVPAQ